MSDNLDIGQMTGERSVKCCLVSVSDYSCVNFQLLFCVSIVVVESKGIVFYSARQEVVVSGILLPVIGLISDPDFINQFTMMLVCLIMCLFFTAVSRVNS